jgi:hypothetical protein
LLFYYFYFSYSSLYYLLIPIIYNYIVIYIYFNCAPEFNVAGGHQASSSSPAPSAGTPTPPLSQGARLDSGPSSAADVRSCLPSCARVCVRVCVWCVCACVVRACVCVCACRDGCWMGG